MTHNSRCKIALFSAIPLFGKILIWHRSLGWLKADLGNKTVLANFTGSEEELKINERLGPDRVIAINLSGIVKNSELHDVLDKPLFNRARKKLGDLQPGECYGFVPAIGLGGTNDLQYLRRLRAAEHFAIIASLAPFELIKFDENFNEVIIRKIGR